MKCSNGYDWILAKLLLRFTSFTKKIKSVKNWKLENTLTQILNKAPGLSLDPS